MSALSNEIRKWGTFTIRFRESAIKYCRIFLVLFVLITVFSTSVFAGTDGMISLMLGGKRLSKDDWGDASSQTDISGTFALGGDTWPFLFVVDRFIGVSDDAFFPVHVEITDEISLGLRHVWKVGIEKRMCPFASAGVTRITGGSYNIVADQEDSAIGFYLDGGLFVEVFKHFHLIISTRYSWAKADGGMLNDDISLGGIFINGGAGIHW